jgi:hypothetical protein
MRYSNNFESVGLKIHKLFKFLPVSNWLTAKANVKALPDTVERNVSSFFFFVAVLGLELRAYTLSHSTSPFLSRVFFKIGSHGTVCPDCLWTVIFLIYVSWVIRITGTHQRQYPQFNEKSYDIHYKSLTYET